MILNKLFKNVNNLLIKVASLMMSFFMLITLSSCDGYVNYYKAIGLVKMQTSHSIELSFYSLEGGMSFKLKKTDSNAESDIKYSIQLDKGEIKLYYDDSYGTKEELAYVTAGESISDSGGYIEGGRMVRIIIEAKEDARGKIKVEFS